KVTTIKGTDILQISFEHTDPIIATQVSDVWAQAFVEQNKMANRLEASSAAKFISAQLAKTKEELSKAETALRDYKQANGAADVIGKEYSGGVKANMDPIRQGLTKDVVAAEVESLGYSTRVASLGRMVGNFNGKMAGLPNKELALTRLMRNASVTAELYKML